VAQQVVKIRHVGLQLPGFFEERLRGDREEFRRFPGADITDVVTPDGHVDGTHPTRVRTARDMIDGGRYGARVALSDDVVTDTAWPEEPARTVEWHPADAFPLRRCRVGDLCFLALARHDPEVRAIRERAGAVYGHMGIVTSAAPVILTHAASRPLPGATDRVGVVSVELAIYLARVTRFEGVTVTRFART